MKKQLLILPFVIFFFIILVFFYLLISGHNPSKLPSALIGKKVPNFESQLLLNDKKFISNKLRFFIGDVRDYYSEFLCYLV